MTVIIMKTELHIALVNVAVLTKVIIPPQMASNGLTDNITKASFHPLASPIIIPVRKVENH